MAGTCWNRHTAVHFPTCMQDNPDLAQQCGMITAYSAQHLSPVLQCGSTDQLRLRDSSKSGKNQQQLCTQLIQQLDAVGWHRIAKVSADLSHIHMHLHDASGRVHAADAELKHGFPVTAPIVCIHLPKCFKLKWLPGFSLLQLVQQLEQALAGYQPLWAQLEDIDQHTQLLDPPHTLAHPYSNCSRCIALGNGASCQLQLSAASPCALPSVTFHGQSSIVAGLQNAWYGSSAQLWDEQRNVRENLEAVLQVQLPKPKPGRKKGCAAVMATPVGGDQSSSQADGAEADAEAAGMSEDTGSDDYGMGDAGCCCICYALHLTDPSRPDELGEAASVACPGASCGRLFHVMCLAEWLAALPTSRRVFDTLFGSCPFCNAPTGVSLRPTVRI